MGQPRDRAWRRRQRARIIKKRQDRLPDEKPDTTKVLWQLHTPYGEPLPLFHRQVWKEGEAPEPTVVESKVWYHRWECDRKNCSCTKHLTPSWPGSQEGWVWVPLKAYRVEDRGYPEGRLSKNTPVTEYKGCWAYNSKNWKLMYLRRNKIARQQKLGWLNYPRRPEDDFDPCEYMPDGRGDEDETPVEECPSADS